MFSFCPSLAQKELWIHFKFSHCEKIIVIKINAVLWKITSIFKLNYYEAMSAKEMLKNLTFYIPFLNGSILSLVSLQIHIPNTILGVVTKAVLKFLNYFAHICPVPHK